MKKHIEIRKNTVKKTVHDFIYCGLTGWCIECAHTGLAELFRGNIKLTSSTSLWMFPIYGLAAFMIPVYNGIKNLHFLVRALIYGLLITSVEFITGSLLTLLGGCPWDYRYTAMNYMGLIRMDYFPLWMFAGLIFEYLVCHREHLTLSQLFRQITAKFRHIDHNTVPAEATDKRD